MIVGALSLPAQAPDGTPAVGNVAIAINEDGQLVLVDEAGATKTGVTADTSTTATHALFATAVAGVYQLRAIDGGSDLTGNIPVARIATALAAPGAIGGTTPGTVAATTASLKGATSGVVTLAAPAAATTATLTFAPPASVTMTTPSSSFTAARTDAGQTFNGTSGTPNTFAGSGTTVVFNTGVSFTYESYALKFVANTSSTAGAPAFSMLSGYTTGLYSSGNNIQFTCGAARVGGFALGGAFDVVGAFTAGNTVIGSVQTVTGSGAVTAPNLTTLTTNYISNGSGTLTATLPSGTTHGQLKAIVFESQYSSESVIITAALYLGTTVELTARGSILLQWSATTSKWMVLSGVNASIT